MFKSPTQNSEDKLELSKLPSPTPTILPGQEPIFSTGQEGLITLSNDDPNEDKLNALMGSDFPTGRFTPDILSLSSDGINSSKMSLSDVKVDVTLRTQLGQAPALLLLITDFGDSADQLPHEPTQVSICFEVGFNGRISVVDSAGLVKKDASTSDTEMQGTDDSEPKLQDVHRKIARVLEITQDLGILVEWVMQWLRQQASSG